MCHICGKKFVKKYVLEKHIFIHANLKPFICSFCNKAFRTENNLKSHIGIHTGEQPFKCGMCPRTFKFSSTAALHRRTHKVGEFYKCTICMADFTATRYLFYHLKNFHKDEKKDDDKLKTEIIDGIENKSVELNLKLNESLT